MDDELARWVMSKASGIRVEDGKLGGKSGDCLSCTLVRTLHSALHLGEKGLVQGQ
jgi:hypothetical protein